MKILIVDDNEANCQLLKRSLSGYGTLVTVNSGMDAIKAFNKAFKKDETFDLIFLDCCMPQMNGIDTLKAIRTFESDHHTHQDNRVRVIMMSAADSHFIVKNAYAVGCDSFMLLPSRREQVIEHMHQVGLSKQIVI